MIFDAQNRFSNAQALTATAVSADVIDLGALFSGSGRRQIEPGEPMAVVVNFNVALAGTSPTINVAVQSDDNSGFSSALTLITSRTLTAAPAGTQLVIPLPEFNERFLRLNYTLGGTSPTATVTASLVPMSHIGNAPTYPSAVVVN